MKFKVGDRVRCVHNDNGSDEYVGSVGVVMAIIKDSYGGDTWPYKISFSNDASFSGAELELVAVEPTPAVITEPDKIGSGPAVNGFGQFPRNTGVFGRGSDRKVYWNKIHRKHKHERSS